MSYIVKCTTLNNNHHYVIHGSLPRNKEFSLASPITNLTIFDDRERVVSIVDFDVSSINTDKYPEKYDITMLGTDQIDSEQTINRINRTYSTRLNSEKHINLLELFNRVNKTEIIGNVDVETTGYHVDNKVGLKFSCSTNDYHYKQYDPLRFISNFTNLNLSSETLKPILKDWMTDTQKTYNFISNAKNIEKYYEFKEHLSYHQHITLETSFCKSYFNSFKTMVERIDLSKFEHYDMNFQKQEKYCKIIDTLLKVTKYGAKYNIGHIKVTLDTSKPNKINISFAGNTFTVGKGDVAKSLLAYIDMCGELDNLEMNIDRTLLLNS